MKLSIVIPVYNVEQYLRECLDSCLEQDIDSSEYEIITVNDGSTDDSLAILEEYAQKYNNIILVNQENLSASVARNKGIELAKGEYIWFVDSDDKIEKNCLSKVVDGHTEDIVMFGGYYQYNEQKISPVLIHETYLKNILLDTTSFEKDVVSILPLTPWMYLFKRNFLLENQLRYVPGIYFEDVIFTPHCVCLAQQSIEFLTGIFYYYRFNPLSMTNHITKKKSFSFYYIAKEIRKIQSQNFNNQKGWYFFFQKYVEMGLMFLFTTSIKLPSNERKEAYALIKEDKEMQQAILGMNKIGPSIKLTLLNHAEWMLPIYIHLEEKLILPVKRYFHKPK